MKCFNVFVQSAVYACGRGDEILFFSAKAETVKKLANTSYGYQTMDCSRQVATENLNYEKMHASIKNKMFKKLAHINDDF